MKSLGPSGKRVPGQFVRKKREIEQTHETRMDTDGHGLQSWLNQKRQQGGIKPVREPLYHLALMKDVLNTEEHAEDSSPLSVSIGIRIDSPDG